MAMFRGKKTNLTTESKSFSIPGYDKVVQLYKDFVKDIDADLGLSEKDRNAAADLCDRLCGLTDKFEGLTISFEKNVLISLNHLQEDQEELLIDASSENTLEDPGYRMQFLGVLRAFKNSLNQYQEKLEEKENQKDSRPNSRS